MFGKRNNRRNKSVTLMLAMLMVLQIFVGGFGGVSFAEEPKDSGLIGNSDVVSTSGGAIQTDVIKGPEIQRRDLIGDPVTWGAIELKHIDSAGNPVTGDFKIGSHVEIKFNYEIADYDEVDTTKTYDFIIPEEIQIIAPLNFPLMDGSRKLANVVVNTDGTMTVQFLPEINNEDFEEDRTGWVSVDSKFDETKLGDGGDKTITFEVDGKSKDVSVKFEEVEKTVALEKSGKYNENNNEITWTIKVKPTTQPEGRTIKDIAITDIIQDGQTYIASSAKLGSDTINPDPVTGNVLNYTFDELQDGANQTITFKTKADTSEFVNQADVITFKNTVAGTYGDDNTPISSKEAKVTTTVNFIEKTGEEVAGQGKINWTIEINNNNLELPAGVVVEDLIGEGLKYNYDLAIDGNPITDYGTIVDSDTGFTFTFTNAINIKHTITYSTQVTDEGAYDSNEEQTYYNKANIRWPDKPGGGTSTGDIGVGVSTSVIKKTGVNYNADTHEVTWKIVVNSNKIRITNPIVTDELPKTLEIVESKTIIPTGWQLTKPIIAANGRQNLEFKYSGEINESYTITLVTKIKDQYKEYFGDNSTKTINNIAKLTGEGVKDSESEGSQRIVSQVIKKSALDYDYTTRIAKWQIVVNQNKMPITNAVVTDVIGDNHEFIVGSLDISGVDNASSMYTVDEKTITITLGDITTEKTITFETQIPENKVEEFFQANGDKELKNNSTLTGNEINGIVGSNATQKVKNTVVSKKGKYTRGNDYIDWEVIINSNELQLNNVKLEDTLQTGLIFDSQSVELIKLTINPGGTHTEDSIKTIDTIFDPDTNKVTFNIGNITDAYILKFRTDVEDEYSNETFNNTISLSGSNGDQTGVSTAIGVSFQTGDAGGSGSSTRGSLTLVKVDTSNPTKMTYLQGAKFELYKSDKTTLEARSDATGANGEVLFDNLRMGKYYIKEIQAPEGYILDSSLKEVELRKGLDTKHIIYEFENDRIKGNVEFNKADEENQPLAGAKFGIYLSPYVANSQPVSTANSDQSGKVRFRDIPYGEYIIKEMEAPRGYEPSIQDLNVSIKDNNETIVLNETVTNNRAIGDIEIYKQGENEDTLLSGAVFELVQEGEVKYTSEPTNDMGRTVFVNIEYGDYMIREKEAPTGYILGVDTQTVTISNPKDEIQTFVFSNTEIRGDVEIIKIDSSTESPLKDSTIGIFTEDDVLVEEKVTGEDGIVRFNDLTYGNYYFMEIKSPSGYYLNDEKYNFTIEEELLLSFTLENTRIPSNPSEREGKIKIIKKDRDTNELLSGAEFDILDSKGKRVDTLITNSRGEATSKWLPIGEYTIREVKAPKGYKLDTKLGEERVRNRETVEIQIYNEKVDPRDPTDPEPQDQTDPTDPTEPTEPDKPNKPGEEDEFEDFDNANPAGGTDIDGPKPLLPKTGSDSTTILLILGVVVLTSGLLLRIKKMSKKT